MARPKTVLLLTAVVIGILLPTCSAIGENMLNVGTFAGVMRGLGNMFSRVDAMDINVDRITGRWFQMYKAAINFDVFRNQMFCPVAYFKPNPVMGRGGFTIEEAYRTISKIGPIETYKRDVNRVSPGQYWMYTEEYFYPRQLIFVKAGPEIEFDDVEGSGENSTAGIVVQQDAPPYEYLVATDANRLALMVFARDPLAFLDKYNEGVLSFLKKTGFGGNSFWNAPKPIYQGADCEWPNQREVFARRVLKNQQRQQNPQAQPNAPPGGLLNGFNANAQSGQAGPPGQPAGGLLNGFGTASALQTFQHVIQPIRDQGFGQLLNNAIQG